MKKFIKEIIMLPSAVTDVTDVQALCTEPPAETSPANASVADVTNLKVVSDVPQIITEPCVPAGKRPCWHVYDDWIKLDNGKTMRPGTYFLDIKKKGKPEDSVEVELIDLWVCSPLHIDAQTFDTRGNSFGRLLRFKDSTNKWKTWAMPMELLRGSGEDLRGTLLSMGVLIEPTLFREFSRYLLQTVPPKQKLHCVLQTGWNGRRAYVLPDKVIGPEADQVVFQSSQAKHVEFGHAGTLPAWKESVASVAIKNPMLMLGISSAFVGPLLQLTNSEGGGVHLVGDSSSGKTTIAKVAASVWGGKEFKRSWKTTANGLEGVAALCNDGLLILDEISECNPSDVSEITYAVGNGCRKQRADRNGGAKAMTRWLCFVLSTGERTIETVIKEGGGRVKAGQTVRLLDLYTKRQYGVWDDLDGLESGAALADHVSDLVKTNYGHAGRAFLEKLTNDDTDFCARLNLIKNLPEFKCDGAEGQKKRAAAKFAIMALAGEVASEYGITGWPLGAATKAAAIGWQIWQAQIGKGNKEDRQIHTALSDFIEKHGDSRFSNIDDDDPIKTVNNRAGYWRDGPDGRTFYLNSDGMNEALHGFDLKSSLDLLVKDGVIPPANDKGERARPMRVGSKGKKSARLYAVDFSRLTGFGAPIFPATYPES